jgi:hypothetical protein
MPVPKRRRTLRAVGTAAVAASLTSACSIAPSVDVVGAYFPDWLFCIVAGVVLAIVVFKVLSRAPDSRRFGPPAVIYPTLVTLFALVVWLIFFQQ